MKFMVDRIWREVHMALQWRIASRRQNTGWDQGWIHSLLSPSDLLLPARLHLLKVPKSPRIAPPPFQMVSLWGTSHLRFKP